MTDMPEHDKRAGGESEDIGAAYRYVESVAHTMDAEAIHGHYHAWHGWALREAFLAGMSAKDASIATLTARVEHYKRACIATSTEVTRVLGEALYGPNPDAWSTHTPEAIADEAASEIATLRAENERMRGEIITYQDAHTTGTEIIDGLRAKVEALEPSDDVIELIRVAIDPDEPRLSGSCRAMVDVWLQRVEARKGGE